MNARRATVERKNSTPSFDLGDLYRYIDTRLLDRIDKLTPNWNELCKSAGFTDKPPACLTDFMFCALVSSFANPFRREILKKLIADVLADDLIDLLGDKQKGGDA